MAFPLDHGDDEMEESHEINVTPFIDVILVLLIIFVVAAPLATVDVPVELPSSTTAAQPRPDKPIFLTLRADKTLALGDAPVAPRTWVGHSTRRAAAIAPSASSCARTRRSRTAT